MRVKNPGACPEAFAENCRSGFTPRWIVVAQASRRKAAPTPNQDEEDIELLKPGKEAWLERMWHPTVLLDGRIAVVWTPYDFHRDGKFSHNGIDVFTLMKLEGSRKIVRTAYTKERQPPSRHPAESPPANPGGANGARQ